MRLRTEFLVEKRGGRFEGLRITKLARSIAAALPPERAESWRVMELASAVLAALRSKRGFARPLRSDELAAAVQQVLIATGDRRAAQSYARERHERDARRRVLGRIGQAGGGSAAGRIGTPGSAVPETRM